MFIFWQDHYGENAFRKKHIQQGRIQNPVEHLTESLAFNVLKSWKGLDVKFISHSKIRTRVPKIVRFLNCKIYCLIYNLSCKYIGYFKSTKVSFCQIKIFTKSCLQESGRLRITFLIFHVFAIWRIDLNRIYS